jgi:hypothetical protein
MKAGNLRTLQEADRDFTQLEPTVHEMSRDQGWDKMADGLEGQAKEFELYSVVSGQVLNCEQRVD